MNITKKIEDLRIEKGWSIAKLARMADIPTVSLRVMLNREDSNNYNVIALKKIADSLGTTVSELTKEEFEEAAKPKLNKKQQTQLQEVLNKAISDFFEYETTQLVIDDDTGEIIDDS